jgi:hypothetical protein
MARNQTRGGNLMAHSIFHFGIGTLLGALCGLPYMLARLRSEGRSAPAALSWLGLSFAAGIFAIVPAILMNLGLPESIGRGWWMNIFLLHPLIDNFKEGGLLWGQLLVLLTFILQYTCLLILLRKAGKRYL